MPTELLHQRPALTHFNADSRDDGIGNLLLILGLCALGFVITLRVIFRIPALGALIECYNQF